MRRLRLWGTGAAVVGVTTIIALATTNPHDTALDWFLMGSCLVAGVAWAVETTSYYKDH
jgi:hypothetical protein